MKIRFELVAGVLLGLIQLCAPSAHAAWDSFEIIQWQSRDVARLKTLRGLGVSAVAVIPDRDGTGLSPDSQTAAPLAAGLRWYLENIATDFYASYHRWTPGKIETWRFLEAQERYQRNMDDTAALMRQPSLLDPAWRTRVAVRLAAVVKSQKRHHPLYYSLGDETGIDDLAAFWDFDLSPESVAGFRKWLPKQYASLAALNAEWGTSHRSWDDIQSETTRQAMRRGDDNFAAWSDFKAWMDTSFADALRFGTEAVHRADPTALSGIEGAQIPGWGGYDYTKLAHAVDLMEIYDDGENVPIVRSLNPRLIPLATSFTADTAGLHAIWRGALRGTRGLILWDEDDGIVRPDASPGPRAAAYAPVFAALRGEIGRRLVTAEPIHDPVAVLYSPVSFRVRWMLDHRPEGDAWTRRSAEIELGDNAYRIALREYVAALSRMGLRPRFITPEQLAAGPPRTGALILPHALALSDREMAAVTRFAARGGRVIADVPPGSFDGHGRRRAVTSPAVSATIAAPAELAKVLPLRPMFRVEAPEGDVETYVFRSRGRRLLALHRRAPANAAGPVPAGAVPAGTMSIATVPAGTPPAGMVSAETVTVHLNGAGARDLVTNKVYGGGAPISLTLDPITPTFLELGR